jgi:energy-coupling factor transporter ATP-binding protein EcfA2
MTGAEVKTAVELLVIAQKQGWLERLIDSFKKKHRILVLGSSGTGKTNFIKSLTQLIPEAVHALNRSEFIKAHHLKIDGHPFVFVDTPGQHDHASKRITAIQDAMKDSVAGIINVVSYGYHEGPASLADVFEADGSLRGSFLANRRQIEIEAMAEWKTHLASREIARWLMTVITKADLWWDSREAVYYHYQFGDYGRALGAAQVLQPVVLGYSSVVHRFYDRGHIATSFDDAQRLRLRGHLFAQLIAAIGR